MKTTALIIATLTSAAACSKSEKSDGTKTVENRATEGGKPSTDPGTPPGTTPAGTTAATPKLDCDRVVSKDLREKYFKGYTFENRQAAVDFSGQCELKPPAQDPAQAAAGRIVHGGALDVSCHENVKLAKVPTIEALQKNFKDMKPIDGIPDSLAFDAGPGWQFNVWDTDSNCALSGLVPKGVDGPAFVKEWLGAFPLK